jgi:23S rRNA pseudouridine1911/1915/1917 synthase
LLAVVKPAGIPTQKSVHHPISLEEMVRKTIKTAFLQPIHRLDRDVSGIVLFAKTKKSLSRMQEAMRKRKIKKIYFARVEGHLKQKKGQLVHYIAHGEHRAKISKTEGKQATLSYEVMKEEKTSTIVRIELLTGRYHQIRLQFSHIGHPIVGDTKYGSKIRKDRIDLHHAQMEFIHPVKKNLVILESSIDFYS